MSPEGTNNIHVAIIGGGITGIIFALGLQKRGVGFTLYERTPGFTELGAGIGFSPNAERAFKIINPEIDRVYKKLTAPTHIEEHFQWVDGYKTNEVAARLLIGVDSFLGGRRSDFVDGWSELISKDHVKFNKELAFLIIKDDGKVSLQFKDGSVDEADVVIGCDGIHSRVRQLILGETNPASYASYTNKYCFRALVPMEKARAALGAERTTGGDKSLNRFMYNGPNAHSITYPVAQGQFLNILLVISDPNPWKTEDGKHTASGSKGEALRAYEGWHPQVRAIADMMPDELQKWAIFDMYENPAPYYYRDSVAIAGDAAHAAGPHLGSGAGFGIEDGLVLATVLEAVNAKLDGQSGKTKVELCRDALAAYNNMRYDRTQWLVGATREAVALFHWQDENVGSDFGKFLPEITKRFHKIWNHDVDKMVKKTLGEFERLVRALPN
ncbi:FAD/NAD(P)-binding domain-containing protein [Annulohypoxylon maeteangense]|uniref:FAD/NAD(P)-binding domain-containing protein n=1 Tax=Annulohypoxylon maeteangense TaxID=1927788 RepID=UPI0020089A56|nr:FAD/NAD(P)-binding domain-containing protein [Annulohypoxylon maeteangense]KAI0886360.1 FAD/NAD(P)-binding domain-containing protein [Annulohypoxylon maeteangense]